MIPHVNALNVLGFIVDTLTLNLFYLTILFLGSLLRPSQCTAYYKQRYHGLGFVVETLTCMYADWNELQADANQCLNLDRCLARN